MPAYEYLMITFERSPLTMFSCAGFTFEGVSEDTAREHFRSLLRAGSLADTKRRRREARAANDSAYLRWVKQRDEKRKRFSIAAVEAQSPQGGRVPQDQVTFPDGTIRTFAKGEGLANVDDAIAAEIGPPPPELDSFDDMSDAQLLDHLLSSMARRHRDVWIATAEPPLPIAALPSSATRLDGAVTTVLNAVGSDGWQLVDVSEDRAIVGGSSGTESAVVAARYTLTRLVER